jgi:hypothetical protein
MEFKSQSRLSAQKKICFLKPSGPFQHPNFIVNTFQNARHGYKDGRPDFLQIYRNGSQALCIINRNSLLLKIIIDGAFKKYG